MIDSIVHVATDGKGKVIFLRKGPQGSFQWGEEGEEFDSLPKALEYAWKENFSLLLCGYKFTLPERDEHGTPALFEEMAKSLNSMTGVYFDEREGLNCIVHQIPTNTRRFFEAITSAQAPLLQKAASLDPHAKGP